MAKDVITRFKLETTQYDSKMRSAVKELNDFAKTATQAGGNFNNFTKKQVEAARAIGNMETTCTDAKGKVKELVSSFNDFARTYNALNDQQKQGDFAKAMAESLMTLQGRIKQAKAEMQGLSVSGAQGGGGFLSGLGGKMDGMMAVLGGNLMTKGVSMAAGFASEMGEMIAQSVQLAKEGEGIRIAFERLGRGDILDGLRKATHGTVTDIELMKAAVKFNDFNLPVEELGTMLAFAQQKAKDTGQSVDYMVDSIVTGLGRKSLMILDNLGLSAAEIKEEMKKTGDMTTAVGAIIRKQMQSAGDYVETAADKAAQADVELKNAMEELGRTFAPLAEAGSSLWKSLEIGAINLLNNAVRPLIDALTTAGRLRKSLNDQLGTDSSTQFVNQQLAALAGSKHKNFRYNASMKYYNDEIAWRTQYAKDIRAWQSGQRGEALSSRIRAGQKRTGTDFLDASLMERQANEFRKMQADFRNRAQAILNPQKKTPEPLPEEPKPTKTRTSSHTTTTPAAELTEEQKIQKQINDLVQEGMGMDEKARTAQREKIAALQTQLEGYKKIKDELLGIEKKEKEVKPEAKPEMAQGLSGVTENSLKANQSYWQGKLGGMEIGSEEYMRTQANIIDTQSFNTILNEAMKRDVSISDETKESIMQGLIDGESVREELVSLVEIINETLADSGIEPIKLDFDTGNVKKETKEVNKEWNAAASAIQAVGSAMSQIEDPAAKVMGTIAQAIASVALAAGQAMAAKDTTASGWAWIGAAAAITATMVTTIAAMKSATAGSFANGGIVPGTSYSGDRLLAHVNSGELILNTVQQNSLASALSNPLTNIHLETSISGRDLKIVLDNDSLSRGKGKFVTSNTY